MNISTKSRACHSGRRRTRPSRYRARGALFQVAFDGRDRGDVVGDVEQFPARCDPVFRAAWRGAPALRHGRAHVQRSRAVDSVDAGRAHAPKYHRVRDVRGDFRLECRHRRDHWHGGNGGDREARLLRAPLPRHDRRGRNARHPDSALDQHDRVRRVDRFLDPEALPCRHHSGVDSRRAVQPGRADFLHRPAATGRQTHHGELGSTPARAARSDSAAGDLSCRHRLDLRLQIFGVLA